MVTLFLVYHTHLFNLKYTCECECSESKMFIMVNDPSFFFFFFCLQPSLEVSASEVCTVSLCHESIEETSLISFYRGQLSYYMYIGVIYMVII